LSPLSILYFWITFLNIINEKVSKLQYTILKIERKLDNFKDSVFYQAKLRKHLNKLKIISP